MKFWIVKTYESSLHRILNNTEFNEMFNDLSFNDVYTWEHVLLCVWWVVYCEAGCPGRTGARRPPCATSPVHRACGVQRTDSSGLSGSVAADSRSRMLILAADFRAEQEARSRRTSDDKCGRWLASTGHYRRWAAARLGSAHAPRTLHNKQ